jgi:hypothetical protein
VAVKPTIHALSPGRRSITCGVTTDSDGNDKMFVLQRGQIDAPICCHNGACGIVALCAFRSEQHVSYGRRQHDLLVQPICLDPTRCCITIKCDSSFALVQETLAAATTTTGLSRTTTSTTRLTTRRRLITTTTSGGLVATNSDHHKSGRGICPVTVLDGARPDRTRLDVGYSRSFSRCFYCFCRPRRRRCGCSTSFVLVARQVWVAWTDSARMDAGSKKQKWSDDNDTTPNKEFFFFATTTKTTSRGRRSLALAIGVQIHISDRTIHNNRLPPSRLVDLRKIRSSQADAGKKTSMKLLVFAASDKQRHGGPFGSLLLQQNERTTKGRQNCIFLSLCRFILFSSVTLPEN